MYDRCPDLCMSLTTACVVGPAGAVSLDDGHTNTCGERSWVFRIVSRSSGKFPPWSLAHMMAPSPICFMLLAHMMRLDPSVDLHNPDRNTDTSTKMIPNTTNNSMIRNRHLL